MRRLRTVAAPLLAGALVVAACGGSDSDSEPADEPAPAEDEGGEEPAEEPADDEPAEEPADDEPAEEPADDDAMEDGDDAMEDGDDAMDDDAMSMDIQRGGTLVALLEAESDTWDIPGANCAVSCISVMNQVADNLIIADANNELQPFLLESFSTNDDFTEWTLVMRDGVVFHDGTPADGAAVQRSLIEMASGILQGQVFLDLAGGASPLLGGDPSTAIQLVDDKTVTVSFDVPFATFGYNLAGRTGWLIAPSFWDSETRAADLMIATGPFRMVEQVRGEVTRLEANPDYWRTDGNGEALPYLDAIDFRPVPDVSARRATMEAGDADLNMDSFGENKEFWTTEWLDAGNSLQPIAADRETSYLMFNNAVPPFDDPDLRRAVALCTDRDEYIAFRAPGNDLANGPFAEGSAGYIEDPGFPQFDPDAGNALLDEIGRPEVINYGTTNVPSNLLTAELFADMWSTNCGLNVNIDQFDQSELITRAIGGAFEVFAWRNHGQGNPGLEYVWWHSRHAEGLALNFGRIVDTDLDALLQQTWATTDQGELDELGKQINTLFAENVYNLWLNTTEWNNGYRQGVHGINTITIGGETQTVGSFAGRYFLQEAWVES